MKKSPLQLLRYIVSEASCAANPTFDLKKAFGTASEQLSVGVKVNQQQSPEGAPWHSWTVEITISQKSTEGQNLPYRFEVTLVGFFACRGPLPADVEESRFVQINGSSMLYGAAREIVRSLTARGPWGVLFLPCISFYEMDSKPKEEAAPVSKPG